MIRCTKLLIIIFLGLLNLSMYFDSNYKLLSPSDFEILKQFDSNVPTLSAALDEANYWESYSEWICFPIDETTAFSCSEQIMDEVIKTPMISVSSHGESFEIEASVTEGVDCDKTIFEWSKLLTKRDSFCVLAAYLQDLPPTSGKNSLWILDALKTQNGYWISPTLSQRMELPQIE